MKILVIIIAALCLAAGLPPVHLVVHTEEINSDRVFVSDLTYDSLGRRLTEVSGVLDPDARGRHHDRILHPFTTTIRYAGDSVIQTLTAHGTAPRILTLVLDSFGHYTAAGTHVQYDTAGYVTCEADTGHETHIIMLGADVAARYGWSRYAGVVHRYQVSYSYYPEYDTRSYGISRGRQERQHLLRRATYIHEGGAGQDTIVTEYSYDFGTDSRILLEHRTERSTSASHPSYWTARYTYAD